MRWAFRRRARSLSSPTASMLRARRSSRAASWRAVAASHVRVGTFQFFAARGDTEALALLVQSVIERSYPTLATRENPPLALLEAVIGRQAALIADWMIVGFIHGVMNTDNMAVSGETIDFGPCAFMDAYDPATVFSSIDHMGRYAYANQPRIAHWNLARLAETLLPLIDPDSEKAVALATEAIGTFPQRFEEAVTAGLRRKLGLLTQRDGDLALAQDLLQVMAANRADFTLAFRRLGDDPESLRELFATTGGIDSWIERWRAVSPRSPDAPTNGERRCAGRTPSSSRAITMWKRRSRRRSKAISPRSSGFTPCCRAPTTTSRRAPTSQRRRPSRIPDTGLSAGT